MLHSTLKQYTIYIVQTTCIVTLIWFERCEYLIDWLLEQRWKDSIWIGNLNYKNIQYMILLHSLWMYCTIFHMSQRSTTQKYVKCIEISADVWIGTNLWERVRWNWYIRGWITYNKTLYIYEGQQEKWF